MGALGAFGSMLLHLSDPALPQQCRLEPGWKRKEGIGTSLTLISATRCDGSEGRGALERGEGLRRRGCVRCGCGGGIRGEHVSGSGDDAGPSVHAKGCEVAPPPSSF
eukprot:3669534-Rhodomonas_salina.1